jgi:hypothetical protein
MRDSSAVEVELCGVIRRGVREVRADELLDVVCSVLPRRSMNWRCEPWL